MKRHLKKLLICLFIFAAQFAEATPYFSGSTSVLFVSRYEIESDLRTNPELAEAVRRKLGNFYVAKVTRYDYATIRSIVMQSENKIEVKLCDDAKMKISYVPSLDVLIGVTNTGVKFLMVTDNNVYQSVRRHCTYSTPGMGMIK